MFRDAREGRSERKNEEWCGRRQERMNGEMMNDMGRTENKIQSEMKMCRIKSGKVNIQQKREMRGRQDK